MTFSIKREKVCAVCPYLLFTLLPGWPDAKIHMEDKMMKKGGHFPKKEDNGKFNKFTM